MKKKAIPLSLQSFLGMCLGIVAGIVLKEHASPLGDLGRLIIQLIKIVAVPLVFFAVLNSIISSQIKKRGVTALFAVSIINASAALVIALTLANVFKVGSNLAAKIPQATSTLSHTHRFGESLSVLNIVKNIVPDSLLSPFLSNSVLSIILIALLFGVGIASAKKEVDISQVQSIVRALYQACIQIISKIVHLVPLAIFAVVAKSVGEHGFSILTTLGSYVTVCVLGLLLQIILVYGGWIALFSNVKLKDFVSAAKEPVSYAFGVNSSLATLPITLKSLDKLKIKPAASTLSACLGTNLNNDGIILYEAMAVLFVAQAYGIHLSLPDQFAAGWLCVLAALGIAGVPEAGVISLSVVLTTLKMPLEVLPLLLSVDWIIARCRSVTNVLADMTGATVLDRILKS
ncbi:MAG: dicarboxylate/amino acid:cation symporter [Bacteriovoracia bacterium]